MTSDVGFALIRVVLETRLANRDERPTFEVAKHHTLPSVLDTFTSFTQTGSDFLLLMDEWWKAANKLSNTVTRAKHSSKNAKYWEATRFLTWIASHMISTFDWWFKVRQEGFIAGMACTPMREYVLHTWESAANPEFEHTSWKPLNDVRRPRHAPTVTSAYSVTSHVSEWTATGGSSHRSSDGVNSITRDAPWRQLID